MATTISNDWMDRERTSEALKSVKNSVVLMPKADEKKVDKALEDIWIGTIPSKALKDPYPLDVLTELREE